MEFLSYPTNLYFDKYLKNRLTSEIFSVTFGFRRQFASRYVIEVLFKEVLMILRKRSKHAQCSSHLRESKGNATIDLWLWVDMRNVLLYIRNILDLVYHSIVSHQNQMIDDVYYVLHSELYTIMTVCIRSTILKALCSKWSSSYPFSIAM